MSTDPIKLIRNIATPKTTAPKPNIFPSTKSTSSGSNAFKLANSLKQLLANGPSGSTSLKGNYTAKGLKEAFQSMYDAQTKQAATASAFPKSLDLVLKSTKDAGTNAPSLSPTIQDFLKAKKETSTDVGLAKIDAKLAQTVGIGRIIGSA